MTLWARARIARGWKRLVQELGVAASVCFHAFVSENEKANFLQEC